MKSLHEIQQAIGELPNEGKVELAGWMSRLDRALWDAQIEEDFDSGPGAELLQRVATDFEAGRCSRWP